MGWTRRHVLGGALGLTASAVVTAGSAAPSHARGETPHESLPLFGAAVTPYPNSGRSHAEEVAAHEADCGPMGILRTYDGGMPLDWFTPSSTRGSRAPTVHGWETRASWHSIKPPIGAMLSGELDHAITEYVRSIPVTGVPRLLTIWHEPAGKIPGLFSAADWKRAAHRFGQQVAAVGHPDVRYGPCFMSTWTLGSARTNVPDILAADPVDLFEVCDFVGWDPYHVGSWRDDYDPEFTPAYYLDPLIEFTAAHTDAPLAIGETGFKPKLDDLHMRAEWLSALSEYVHANGIIVCCYFDAGVRDSWMLLRTVGETGIRDEPSIAAWADTYRRCAPLPNRRA